MNSDVLELEKYEVSANKEIYIKFKRVIDLLLSFVALIILSPIFLIISLLVKLTSKGPIIYKHKRIGKDGKSIYLYKFRTMVTDANNFEKYFTKKQMEEFKNMTGKNYKFLGIAFSTYIIVEIENEMYIIDQHAAHERIMYEKVKNNYYSSTDKDSQLMLLPDIINLTHKEKEIITENVEMFEKAGFTLEAFGDSTIKLTGVPNICMDMNTKQLFLELLDEIDNYSRTDRQDKEDRFIATIACKSAVKAKMKLAESEVDKLMERLLELPNPFTCPHGRPTAIKMSKYEIERKFARK